MATLSFRSTNRMRKTVKTKLIGLAACALVALAFAPPAGAQSTPPQGAQDEPKAETGTKGPARPVEESQQDRMRRCAHEAKEKELKGEERRSYMSTCLRH
jgi:hypothetical protein